VALERAGTQGGSKPLGRAAHGVAASAEHDLPPLPKDALSVLRGGVPEFLRGLGNFTFHGPMKASVREVMLQRADAAAAGPDTWDPARPLHEARSAHHTNTFQDFAQALEGPWDWMEGDVWLEGAARRLGPLERLREPIMAHDPTERPTLRTSEWLELGIRSGKGLKLDLKHAAAVPDILDLLRRHPVPAGRLMLNMDVVDGPGAPSGWKQRLIELVADRMPSRSTLGRIRKEQPDAIISLGIATRGSRPGDRYTESHIDRLITMAMAAGSPVHFALRADLVTPAIVARLQPYGRVGVWNDPGVWAPDHPEQARREFLAMGCTGIIDLRVVEGATAV